MNVASVAGSTVVMQPPVNEQRPEVTTKAAGVEDGKISAFFIKLSSYVRERKHYMYRRIRIHCKGYDIHF